jgi:serine/threonine protein phosphatase PrpC
MDMESLDTVSFSSEFSVELILLDVSAFVKEKLPVFFEELGSARIEKDPVQALKDAVEMVTSKLARSKINTTFSGTTLVFGFRMGDVLYVGNVGDSRCVLASDSASGLVTKALSWDQKPEVEEERSRIIARGGRVHTLQVPPGEDPGPLRVWLKDVDVPGLAMTRSIGDSVSHSVGVISQPDIQRFELTSDDLFVVWASDGVWEFMENQEVVEVVRKLLPNIEKATTSLVLEAESRWKKFESVVDDITAVILFLKNVS